MPVVIRTAAQGCSGNTIATPLSTLQDTRWRLSATMLTLHATSLAHSLSTECASLNPLRPTATTPLQGD